MDRVVKVTPKEFVKTFSTVSSRVTDRWSISFWALVFNSKNYGDTKMIPLKIKESGCLYYSEFDLPILRTVSKHTFGFDFIKCVCEPPKNKRTTLDVFLAERKRQMEITILQLLDTRDLPQIKKVLGTNLVEHINDCELLVRYDQTVEKELKTQDLLKKVRFEKD